MTSKQRATLRSYAMLIKPVVTIGKGGVNDNMIADINTALECHELIKINVLRSSECSAKELIDDIVFATKAEPVQVIGNKIVLYRYSSKENITHIEF